MTDQPNLPRQSTPRPTGSAESGVGTDDWGWSPATLGSVRRYRLLTELRGAAG
jgi:hypothetical protein